MRDGDVEPTRVVHNALDVLAQVIVAAVSVDEWTSADLFELIRRAYPYHTLTRPAFDEVLAMLAVALAAERAVAVASNDLGLLHEIAEGVGRRGINGTDDDARRANA